MSITTLVVFVHSEPLDKYIKMNNSMCHTHFCHYQTDDASKHTFNVTFHLKGHVIIFEIEFASVIFIDDRANMKKKHTYT